MAFGNSNNNGDTNKITATNKTSNVVVADILLPSSGGLDNIDDDTGCSEIQQQV